MTLIRLLASFSSVLSVCQLVPLNGIHAFHTVDASFAHGFRGADMCHRTTAVALQYELYGKQKYCKANNSCRDEQ